jgi:hypothetical protein
MTLDKAFNIVEPAVKRALPGHPYAPAWATMWLEQRGVENPTDADIQNAVRAYRQRIGVKP